MSDDRDASAAEPTSIDFNSVPRNHAKRPMKDWEEVARFLYDLLDDIDTADDMAKDNEEFYRKRVRHVHARRFEVATTDGYRVDFYLTEALSESALATIVRAADEIERLNENVDRLSGNPADHRYWEGRYRTEAIENERLRDHIRCLLDDDPDNYAADAITVLDVWRKHATDALNIHPTKCDDRENPWRSRRSSICEGAI